MNGKVIDTIREAAAKKQLLNFMYVNKKNEVSSKVVEPYEIKYEIDAFFGFDTLSKTIKRFDISKMSNPEILNQTYIPQWVINM